MKNEKKTDPRSLGRVIRDPVHDYIHLPLELNSLIDEPMMQRLKRVAQTGVGDQVYPGLSGNRHQHSLGVMHLAMEAWRHAWNNCIEIPEYVEAVFDHATREVPELIRSPEGSDGRRESDRADFIFRQTTLAAGILGVTHDVGHSPMAHAGEDFLARHPEVFVELTGDRDAWQKVLASAKRRKTHEMTGIMIRHALFAKQREESIAAPVSFESHSLAWWIASVADSQSAAAPWAHPLRSLVDSPFDVDRLDYMLRDSLLAGTEMRSIDKVRLLQSYELHQSSSGWELGVGLRGRSAVEGLLTQRFEYLRWVFHHPHVNLVHAMLDELLEQVLDTAKQHVPDRSIRPALHYVASSGQTSLYGYHGGGHETDDPRLIEWIRKVASAVRSDERVETRQSIDALADAVLTRRSNWISMWRDEPDYLETAKSTQARIVAVLEKRASYYRAGMDLADPSNADVAAHVAAIQRVIDSYGLGPTAGLNAVASLVLDRQYPGELLARRRRFAAEIRALCGRDPNARLPDGMWIVSHDAVELIDGNELYLYDGNVPRKLTEVAPDVMLLNDRSRRVIQFYCAFVAYGDAEVRQGRRTPLAKEVRPLFKRHLPAAIGALL